MSSLVIELPGAPELESELGEARLVPGPKGDAATVAVGTVMKGSVPEVTNVGTASDAVFDFVLPQGDPGPGLQFDWDGTELGVRVAGQAEYEYTDLRGPAGPAAALISVTLAANGWVDGEQTVENALFLSSGRAYLVCAASGSEAGYAAAGVRALDVTVDGEMTFVCESAPVGSLNVSVLSLEVGP